MKEAYIKAVGIGLGFDLKRAEFSHPGENIWSEIAYVRIDGQEKPNWRFFLQKLGDDHWVRFSEPVSLVEQQQQVCSNLRAVKLSPLC